jgi:hypothetical protein
MLPAVFAGCPDARVDDLESRLAATETRLAEVEAVVAEQRSARVADLARVVRDEATSEMVPVLDADAVVSCAFAALQGLATAEAGHDAAFDSYLTDFAPLGWEIDPSRGCHRYLAVRVHLVENERARVTNFVGEAVVTRGPERGRSFEVDRTNKVREMERRTEAEVVAFTEGPGWIGSAE